MSEGAGQSRARRRQASEVRLLNLRDFGEQYVDFERFVIRGMLPPWPITQCTALAQHGARRCKSHFNAPGQVTCRFHFGNTKRSRMWAIRRYVTWILCGFPTSEALVLEALMTETIEHRLNLSEFYTTVPMVEQIKFLSVVCSLAGIVELGDEV